MPPLICRGVGQSAKSRAAKENCSGEDKGQGPCRVVGKRIQMEQHSFVDVAHACSGMQAATGNPIRARICRSMVSNVSVGGEAKRDAGLDRGKLGSKKVAVEVRKRKAASNLY